MRENNQTLKSRIEELEKEIEEAEDKAKTQEALWIKAFDMVSPKGANSKPQSNKALAFPVPQKKKIERIVPQPREKANYKQNMKTMIHQKYMKKLEDQAKAHHKLLNEQRRDFATQIEDLTLQISEMGTNMIESRMDSAMKR